MRGAWKSLQSWILVFFRVNEPEIFVMKISRGGAALYSLQFGGGGLAGGEGGVECGRHGHVAGAGYQFRAHGQVLP